MGSSSAWKALSHPPLPPIVPPFLFSWTVRLRTFFPPFEDLLQWSYFSIASPLTSPKTLISDPQAGSRINTLGLKSELYPFSCVMRGKGLTSPDFGFLICKKKLRTQPSWDYDGFDS